MSQPRQISQFSGAHCTEQPSVVAATAPLTVFVHTPAAYALHACSWGCVLLHAWWDHQDDPRRYVATPTQEAS